ncbi:MAG: glycosyltransferase family 2 protein [Bacteroidaceae bacterium]|nr:glycosyltransferase family 2 protein [Bacteroidaceae bacterium]
MVRRSQHLVSVIMPMHNSEKFVGKAIESVMEQTYPHWELLVVDDGSTDRSCDVVRAYANRDRRIQLLINDKPTGMPVAPRNYGIERAKGDFIAFLDSDDMWLREKLAQQLPYFFRDNRTAVVFSDYEKIDEAGRRSARVVSTPRKVSYQQLLYGNVIGNLTGIYDVRKVGKNYFKEIRHEDYAFWLSVLKNGYVARSTQTVLALYRVHRNSISSNKLHILSWQWRVYRDVEHIGFFRSLYYYFFYAIKGLRKAWI